MTRAYSINWLELPDAAEIARLEAQIHTPAHRAGQQVIGAQLAETAHEGRNLSLGLYCGERLVGFALVFLAHSRREVASFFDAPLPPELSPDEPVIYIADFAVLPRHRRLSSLIADRFARFVQQREDLRSLCVEAFSTEEYLAFWTVRSRFLDCLGLRLDGKFAYHDAKLGTTMYWLSLQPTRATGGYYAQTSPFKNLRRCEKQGAPWMVGVIDTGMRSRALASQWDALLGNTRDRMVTQRYCYLRSWWACAGALNDLFVPTAVRDGVAAAIAPMQIDESRWLGRPLRRLTFIESPPEVTCVSALVRPDDQAASDVLADYIVAERHAWDSIILLAQRAGDPFLRALESRMRAARLPVSVQPGAPLPRIVVDGSWSAYLDGRPAALRERLADAERAAAGIAGLRFETCTASSDLLPALERFIALELQAPDDRHDGVSASSANVSFFRTLAANHADTVGMRFGFLAHDAGDIAGIVSFASNRHFHPVHVTWDSAYDALDVGLLVTARQLQQVFDAHECDTVVLSSRAVPARVDWASDSIPTVSLYGSRATASGWLLHATYSVGKRWVKRLVNPAAAIA